MNVFSGIRKKDTELGTFALSGLAILVGVVAGFGAIIFRWLIALFHNLFMLGEFSITYDSTVHTPASPWGLGIILVPVIGSFIVTFLVKNFAPEARGHGVPEVMEAIYYKKGLIRPVVALIKSIASAVSIGSGGSVGREGPIIQIGSSFGSTLGQFVKMRTWQRITLIAAGAGGGIAATFNTPIGGILFAIEIMLQEVSVRTLVPVSIATATATYIGRYLLGSSPAFQIPGLDIQYFKLTSPQSLILFIILGLILGVISAVYIKSIYQFEDLFFKKFKANDYVRHAVGMLCVGIMMYMMMQSTGEYYIEGVGYATIQNILSGHLQIFWLLVLLTVLKLFSVSLTLGSGASGGIFSPGLYMGATLGAAYGMILQYLFPGLDISLVAFVVAGMAGVIAGSTGAAMAAIVMIFEMTLDYNVIVPMTFTVALSYGIRKMLVSNSIYTMKLARRGRYIPEALQANYHHEVVAKDMMDAAFTKVPNSLTVKDFAKVVDQNADTPWFIRVNPEKDKVEGLISKDKALVYVSRNDANTLLKDLDFNSFETATSGTKLFDIASIISRTTSHKVLILKDGEANLDSDNVAGVVTRNHIAKAMEQAMKLFSE
ncbi:MAG: chloride channel protein [Balneolaceae bacterium]